MAACAQRVGAPPSLVLATACSATLTQPLAEALATLLARLPTASCAIVAHEKLDVKGAGKSKKEADTRKQFVSAMAKAGLSAEPLPPPKEKEVRLWRVVVSKR